MDAAITELLAQHPSLSLNDRGKIHCSLTGHDVPARLDALQQFIAGRAYQHARAWYAADFAKYEPYIIAHKKDSKKLFCRLTRKQLNRIPEEVEAHVTGRRYNLRKAEADARKAKGKDPFAVPDEEAGSSDGEGDIDMVEFDLIDGGSASAAGAAGTGGKQGAVPASDSALLGDAMDEGEGDSDASDGEEEAGADSDSDDGIEVDDEFFAGNDTALIAAGLIKPPPAKKGKANGGLKKGAAAKGAGGASAAGTVLGKHARDGSQAASAGSGFGKVKKQRA